MDRSKKRPKGAPSLLRAVPKVRRMVMWAVYDADLQDYLDLIRWAEECGQDVGTDPPQPPYPRP